MGAVPENTIEPLGRITTFFCRDRETVPTNEIVPVGKTVQEEGPTAALK
jgi:hypothetical protein